MRKPGDKRWEYSFSLVFNGRRRTVSGTCWAPDYQYVLRARIPKGATNISIDERGGPDDTRGSSGT
jgi:hypothetical protein